MSHHQCNRGFSIAIGYTMTFVAIGLFGCAPQHKDAIMFGTNTQAGLKIGVDERQVPTLILGYNRQEAALIPLFVYAQGLFKDAHRNLDSTNYLELARGRFEKAESEADIEKRKSLFAEGINLVKMAYDSASQESYNEGETPKVSPGIQKLYKLAQKANIADLTTCRLLAEAEIQRPSTAVRYLKEYKYVADCDGQKYCDAYSVLGTFTGSAKGTARTTNSNTVEASGSIAQYFATGLAAQNLSRTPAAVSANTEAVRAASDAFKYQSLTPEQRKEITSDQITREGLADEILDKLQKPDGSLDLEKLKPLIGDNGTLFKGMYTDKEIDGWKTRRRILVRSALTDRFKKRDQLEKLRDAL